MSEGTVNPVAELPTPKTHFITVKRALVAAAVVTTAVVAAKLARSELFASAEETVNNLTPSN